MICKFCELKQRTSGMLRGPRIQGDGFSIFIEDDNGLFTLDFENENDGYIDPIPVHYCPMCGRKLEE